MDIRRLLQQIDEYFEQNRGADAEQLMQEGIALAMQEQDDESLLQLLNELLGYYRETSQVEASYAVAEHAINQAKQMGLEDTLPYATTLLNVANAYRAGGRLQDSMGCYMAVRNVYDKMLAPDNMLVAGLENNISLLYQELGDFQKAKECLLKALSIVVKKNAEFEVAVTYANLASSCMQLGEQEEACSYANLAIRGFEKLGVEDAHYSAALSALGTYYYEEKNYSAAKELFQKSMEIMERNLGRNEYYDRLKENVAVCERALAEAAERSAKANVQNQKDTGISGLELCRQYYETYGRPMIEQQFPDYADKIAVGLVGEGSDCFGYDDALSRDHDWGPDFCMWVTEETYLEIGEALNRTYELLPDEFMGYKRVRSAKGQGRRGVMTISSFYKRLLQASKWEDIDWQQMSDASLAAAVNGEVFSDDEGIFSEFREKLLQGYPEPVRYLKIAESAARFSQAGQYNYPRMLRRGDGFMAKILLADCLKEAMKLQHYIEGKYPPHEKWLHRSIQETERGKKLSKLLEEMSKRSCQMSEGELISDETGLNEVQRSIEQIAEFLASELYEANFISDTDSYLDVHTDELLYKALLCSKKNEELVNQIAETEFKAFDKVRNVGGRAFCQNDWATFSIMRKSQYLTWNRTMLLQYLYDFEREYQKGHNLITEKYGRMMESTAPEEYEQIREHLPVLSVEKKMIIEQIVQLQVAWMEDFAAKYPCLADNARSVRSAEDNLYNTSYETYLRGEISTYSDKMLELYGRYVVEYARENKNLTFEIMENNVHLYGYVDLDSAERFLKL